MIKFFQKTFPASETADTDDDEEAKEEEDSTAETDDEEGEEPETAEEPEEEGEEGGMEPNAEKQTIPSYEENQERTPPSFQ